MRHLKTLFLAFLTGSAAELQALTADEAEQYRAGAGMGYAKAAEQNHFPGPMHVLDLADRLALSAEQRAATERLMQAHKAGGARQQHKH